MDTNMIICGCFNIIGVSFGTEECHPASSLWVNIQTLK